MCGYSQERQERRGDPAIRDDDGRFAGIGRMAEGARDTADSDGIDGRVLCAEQRIDREGSSPSGAQMRGAVSKSGDNTSLAGESGGYGEA